MAPASLRSDDSRTVLLIVDVQVDMFAPGASVHAGETVLKTLSALIARARRAGIPVVYVQNNGGPGDPDQLGTPGWEIHPALAPLDGDLVFQKSSPDAFDRTGLQEELARRAVGRVIIAGLQTEYCIDATCRGASALGYQVVLVKDGHSTYDTEKLPASEVIARHNASLGALVTVAESGSIQFPGEKSGRDELEPE
jgi:nicotinamidase-related amidase